jgi:hypothetical protein
MIQYYITDKGNNLIERAVDRAEQGQLGSLEPELLVLVMLRRGWTTEEVLANAAENIGERQARKHVPRILSGMEREGYIAKDVPLDDRDLDGNGTDIPDVFKRSFPDNI